MKKQNAKRVNAKRAQELRKHKREILMKAKRLVRVKRVDAVRTLQREEAGLKRILRRMPVRFDTASNSQLEELKRLVMKMTKLDELEARRSIVGALGAVRGIDPKRAGLVASELVKAAKG